MIRDRGPVYQLGFGATSRDIGFDPQETEGPNPESGAIAKALHEHPVMRFLAVGAATMAGMAVGGKLVREGGVKLGMRLQNSETKWATSMVKNVRDIQKHLDEWQGVQRIFAEGPETTYDTATKFFVEKDGKIIRDQLRDDSGFFFTQAEKEAAKRNRLGGHINEWTYKDELQKRMVAQARRLPYELPAAYAIQRGLTDRLFGTDEDTKFKGHWYNPLDVMTDFVTVSARNTLTMIAPFEAGTAGASHGWRKAMTLGDDFVNMTPNQQRYAKHAIVLKDLLARVGQDSVDLLNKGVRVSAQTTGAFSAGVQEARKSSMSIVDYMHRTRHGQKQIAFDTMFDKVKAAIKNPELLNAAPGPFRGMAGGIQGAKSRWHEIGAGYDGFEKLMTLGQRGYDDWYKNLEDGLYKDQVKKGLNAHLGASGTPIEELAQMINTLGGGGPATTAFKKSNFFQGQIQNQYTKQIHKALIKEGLSEDAAQQFSQMVTVVAPRSSKSLDTHLGNRIKWDGKEITSGTNNDLIAEVSRRIGSAIDPKSGQVVSQQLLQAVNKTDNIFLSPNYQAGLAKKITNQWSLFEDKIVPQLGDSMLKKTRPDFDSFFGKISMQQQDYLKRRTAQLTGLKLTDQRGNVVADSIINDHLRKMKFDPSDHTKMTGFLTHQKQISKSWQKGGTNVFGLKPMTVTEALNKGYFRGGPHSSRQVSKIVNSAAANDPLTLGSYTVGGVYTSGSGRVIDFNRAKSGFNNLMNRVAAETQIPLIHVSPLELVGFTARQDAKERSILQYIPGMSDQAFTGRAYGKDDFMIWAKNKGRGRKGKVFGFGIEPGADGITYSTATELDGLYIPASAKALNIVSRHAKLALQNLGRAPAPAREIDKNSWAYKTLGPKTYERIHGGVQHARKALSISDDQPDSIFRLARRYKNRHTDINNPRVMSRLLRDGEIKHRGVTHRMAATGELVDEGGNAVKSAQEMADAFKVFSGDLKGKGMSANVISGLAKNPRFDKIFKGGAVDFESLTTVNETLAAAHRLAAMDAGLSGTLDPAKAAALDRAQKTLLWRHLDESGSSAYWNRLIPGGSKSNAINTRIDALKSDMLRYMTIKTGLVDEKSFTGVFSDMMSELDTMRSAGAISKAELTEARAAILSTQINFQSFRLYNREMSPLQNVKDVIESVRHSTSSRAALTDIAEGRVGEVDRFAGISPFLRKRMGTGRYQYEGVEHSPFGDTNTALIPTFGTAFGRNPTQALMSVMGFGTWKNRDAFSGMSIPMSHFIERLNKYSGAFGMALDPTQFSGPANLYTKGMIAKRALPLTAAGATALTVDRTIGGLVNEKDEQGNRVYSPFFGSMIARPFAELQAATALFPGGQGYEEKREEIFEGEVPIRAGRWWPLGNTPFKGGRIQYYRPSWYRRMQSGYQYTDQTYGSPLERLAFGYDFSPLRPLDPYRFEREHYYDRPYPTSGDYFTGPWGPLNPILNATVGRVLKPRREMHQEALQAGLASYQSVGEGAAYMPSSAMPSMYAPGNVLAGSGGTGPIIAGIGESSSSATGIAAGVLYEANRAMAQAGQTSPMRASNMVAADIGAVNQSYSDASGAYGVPILDYGRSNVMRPRMITGQEPISRTNIGFQAGEIGYRSQELFGIYGFAFASMRQSLGFGDKDLNPNRPVLASASAAYGSTRGFWDLNLGGLGDLPLPIEGNYANLEFSEIVRRFIPRERTGTQTVNPIPNLMGGMYPWLPGSDYYLNFRTGDPYTQVQEGEMRLPGLGYERFNRLHSDETGRYGLVDQLSILGDVAPWSTEYSRINRLVNSQFLTPEAQAEVETTRAQVAAKAVKNEFSPYEHKYDSVAERVGQPFGYTAGRAVEWLRHRDSAFNTKFMPYRTAVEDWERQNVYGATFPEWENPIKDFLKPIAYKSTQRDPVTAALITGAVGSLFGRTPAAKTVGSIVGGAVGAASSAYGHMYEMATGDRFVPEDRRKEIALEEYIDILTYTKNMRLSAAAKEQGDMDSAGQYMQLAQQTMYGADVYGGNLQQIAMAIPKRKREHFRAFLSAPEQERDQILSTAGRLERRIYEAAWGRKVEARPNLGEYFEHHELPDENWEGWHPNTNMEDVKIKIGQSLGIDMSEMGYYPQQTREANLLNPSYPDFTQGTQTSNTAAAIRRLMYQRGINGDVVEGYTPYPGTTVHINGGILSGV